MIKQKVTLKQSRAQMYNKIEIFEVNIENIIRRAECKNLNVQTAVKLFK